MKNNIKKILCFVMVVLSAISYANSSTTGPSYIESNINPISINEKGDILCRTRFTKNEMGAQKAMKITFGYCVITADAIIQYTTQELEPDGFPDQDTFSKFVAYWNSIYNSGFDAGHLSEIGMEIVDEYQFKVSNVSSYLVDKEMPTAVFENEKKINLSKTKQLALNGAESTEYFEGKNIHIRYDFGTVLLLKNNNNEFEETAVGQDFDYFNPLSNALSESKNMGFDLINITGVLRISVW